MEDFFAGKGFPYPIGSMDQMFSMIKTKGDKSAVVVQAEGKYFVGYYPPFSAEAVAVDARRIRKYHVTDVGVF